MCVCAPVDLGGWLFFGEVTTDTCTHTHTHTHTYGRIHFLWVTVGGLKSTGWSKLFMNNSNIHSHCESNSASNVPVHDIEMTIDTSSTSNHSITKRGSTERGTRLERQLHVRNVYD